MQLEMFPAPPKPRYEGLLVCHPDLKPLINEFKAQERIALGIAKELRMECDRTRDLNKDDFVRVWDEYWRRNPKAHPSLPRKQSASIKDSKPYKPYRPWSLERKQRERSRRMMERFRKKFSLPELFIFAVQDAVIENPWYYGCCPLPDAGDSFPANVPDLKYLEAIAREAKLREEGK
jgi:hypothetical protein